jgi:redox-sensitive bicupin YhaK (pirin superfamily)
MNSVRRSADRGHANHGWLNSFHSFSFGGYFDSKHVEFGPLRVINEDRMAADKGFGTHPHRDMEIISYVLDGELAHKDSMGNGSVIRPGDVQRMSAGTGIQHSEFNPSTSFPVHFLQIWVQPNVFGIKPSYEEKNFPDAEKRGRLRLIASPEGTDGSVVIHQDARLFVGLFDGTENATFELTNGRRGYVHVARGAARINGIVLDAGDALKVTEESSISIDNGRAAEVIVFDLPVNTH